MDSGRTSTGAYLASKMGAAPSKECWWCDSGDRLSSYYLFASAPQTRELWKSVGRVGESTHWHNPSGRFPQEESATPVALPPPPGRPASGGLFR